MDWVELLLQKSCDKTLQKGEVLHSLLCRQVNYL